MGNVIYRRITNVYDIPSDILVECIGKGLVVHRREDSEISQEIGAVPCSLEVHTGKGLNFDHQGRLAVETGQGICFDCDEKFAVNIGQGIQIDDCGKVSIKLGDGFVFDCDGKINIDTCIASSQTISNITNVTLSIEGRKMVLSKTFTDYKINRNNAGIVLDIEVSEPRVINEEMIISDYGYSACGTSIRASTSTLPNFYQK